MRPFAYHAPGTVAEAVSLLAEKGERARPMAGGTDLLVQLRQSLLELDHVVDVKRIAELSCISFELAGGLTVGAAVSCAELCEQPDVREAYPALIDSASLIGGAAIQGRATIGGNLCNAAPSADCIPAMIVLRAACTVAGPAGTRSVPVEQFCTGPGETVLRAGEILVSIHFPPPAPGSGAFYLRFIPRHEMDIAVAGASASVRLSDGTIGEARIALGAVAPTPLLVDDAAAFLEDKPPTEDVLAEAARIARDAASPITDARGTEPQRRHLVEVLARRALRGAVRRAGGEPAGGGRRSE